MASVSIDGALLRAVLLQGFVTDDDGVSKLKVASRKIVDAGSEGPTIPQLSIVARSMLTAFQCGISFVRCIEVG